MKTLTLKKLSTAVLAATCILGVGVAQAVPKLSITITPPKGTAGANANAQKFYKDLPWLPCVSAETTFGGFYSTTPTGQKIPTVETADQLLFELSATNEDIGDSTGTALGTTKDKLMDFDLYVWFIDPANNVYALKEAVGNAFTAVQPTILGTNFTAMQSLAPRSNYLFMKKDSFGTTAAFSTKLFGGPIELSNGQLPQGMWSVMAIFVSKYLVTDDSDGAKALQNPQNWEAWTVKPFIVGTPFETSVGVTTGTTLQGAKTGGNGTCS